MLRWRDALILAMLMLTAFPASAQTFEPDDVVVGRLGKQIEVTSLFPAGRYFRSDVLFPLVLEYRNSSTVPQRFVIDWSMPHSIPPEYQNLVLEPGAKKRLSFLFPPHAAGQLYSLSINAQSYDSGALNVSGGRVVGVLASGPEGPEGLDYLRSLKVEKAPHYASGGSSDQTGEYTTPQALSSIDATVFPEHWAALGTLDILICHDLGSLGLGDHQYQAVANWVRQGGTLVLLSNGLPDEYRSTPLAPLLPLRSEASTVLYDRVGVKGELHPEASVELGSAEQPLLLQREVAKGKVFMATLPLLKGDILSDEQNLMFWRRVFEPPQPNSNPRQQNRSVFTYSILDSMPELPRAHAGLIALFVLLYGLIVGPINLSILRKKDKMLWAFITVPVVATLFAGGAYIVNRVIRPSVPVARELGVLFLENGDSIGPSESEQVLFSPRSGDYTVTAESHGTFEISQPNHRAYTDRQFHLYRLTPEAGLQSRLTMGTWDIQRFNCRAVLQLDSPVSVRLDDGKVKKATIGSPLESTENDAVLTHPVLGTSQAFTLKKGTHDYPLSFSSVPPNAVFTHHDDREPGRQQLIDHLLNNQSLDPGRARLFFFSTEPRTPLQVDRDALHRHDFLVVVEIDA